MSQRPERLTKREIARRLAVERQSLGEEGVQVEERVMLRRWVLVGVLERPIRRRQKRPVPQTELCSGIEELRSCRAPSPEGEGFATA
jgi:hypothetical protein